MNLPNKLTILRVVAVPFIVALLLWDETPWMIYLAGGLFVLAALTDLLDGHLARKHDMITNFGKFMDPLADKLLVCAVLICFCARGEVPAWALVIIIAREFAISGFRLVAVEKGLVIAAGILGKLKTNVQMVWVIFMLFPFEWGFRSSLGTLLMLASVLLTVWSFADYIWKNRAVLKEL